MEKVRISCTTWMCIRKYYVPDIYQRPLEKFQKSCKAFYQQSDLSLTDKKIILQFKISEKWLIDNGFISNVGETLAIRYSMRKYNGVANSSLLDNFNLDLVIKTKQLSVLMNIRVVKFLKNWMTL